MAELPQGEPWQPGAERAVVLPRAQRTRLVVPDVLLTDALAVLAAAGTRADAASCCLPLLVQRPGVRAVAVVARSGRSAVVIASAGYDCGTMRPGAELPLDAGLPVTEAVRTGRAVVQGDGPSWLALPFGGGAHDPGALLLSLTAAPPESPADLARLHRLARALGSALDRCREVDDAAGTLAAVRAALQPGRVDVPGWDVAVRSLPVQDGVGGDVVAGLADGRGGTWLLAADVVGSGMVAALLARSVRAAARAAAPWAPGPSALLEAMEHGIADDVPPGCFVTAVATHVDAAGTLRAATAGHPVPVVLADGTARPLPVDAGPPLAVEGGGRRPDATTRLPTGATLLLHTDGLVERRGPSGVRMLDATTLAGGLPADLELLADRLLSGADAVGRAEDDVSVLLARRRV